MADAAQDQPEVGFSDRPAAFLRRRSKQPVGQTVELAGTAFERVGQPIDNRFEQLGEDPGAGEAGAVRGRFAVRQARERGQFGKAHRDQAVPGRTNPTGVDMG